MPFKIKLKKSRHYNVTSKSLFVISVHHLLGNIGCNFGFAKIRFVGIVEKPTKT